MSRALPAALPLVFLLALAANGATWTPEKVLDVRYVGDPAIAPDGRRIAYTVWEARTGPELSDERGHVWVAEVGSGDAQQFTRGEESCWSPAWAPDGRRIAFLSDRGSEAVNLWLIPLDGGEAVRLTDVETGVRGFRWSPDGRRIAFRMQDPRSEAMAEAARARDDARVVDRDLRFVHLWQVEIAGDGTATEPVRVTAGDYHVDDFDFSPDGERFVLSHQPTPHEYDWRNTDVSTIAVGGGELRALVRHPGMDRRAVYSPDGRTVAFVSDRGTRSWARDWRICLVAAEGGEVTVLAPTWDRLPGQLFGAPLHWAGDGSGVYYLEAEGTSTHFFFLPADGGPWRRITEMPGAKWDFDLRGSAIAFAAEDFAAPPEVWMQPPGGAARKVTAVHAHLAEVPVGRAEVIRWRSFDGLEIEGLLRYPRDWEAGRRYPLVVELHGGPSWAFPRSFGVMDSLTGVSLVLTDHGFLHLRVNPRGSSGRGKQFRFANVRDWGGADVSDVLAGVDHLIAEGLADPERLGVFGWSYGGFLTSMVISRSDRFRAAMVGAAPTDLVSFSATTDVLGFIPSFLESEFWENRELWLDRSAVFHAADVSTPTLLLYGENDRRVPPSQGYELYRALQRRGVETRMVVYPRSGHGIAEPKLGVDALERVLDWFTGHLSQAAADPTTP